MTRRLRPDDRGVSTLVNHVLAIGITSILIVGLLTAGTSYIQDQQEYAGQDGIETIGNELARDVTQLLRLSAGNGEATITTELPERVAGRSYDANVRDGSACDQQESTPNSCLVLEINGLDITRTVPLSVDESDIEIDRLGAGRYQLDYTGPGLGEADADSDVTRLSLRVGIGDDVQQEREGGSIVGQTNLPPTNVSFEMAPEWPENSRDIEFTADAVDPDATDPSNPGMNYSWDFDSDGSYEVINSTSETAMHNYGSYGRKNVTLRVTDERGSSTWKSKNVSVSGLQYVDGSIQTTGSSFGGENVSFKMENTHGEDINIVGLFFRPVDGADEIVAQDDYFCDRYAGDGSCVDVDRGYNYEILFDTDNDGSWDHLHDFDGSPWEYANDGEEIPDSGLSVSATYGDGGGQKRIDWKVDSGDTVLIRFNGVEGIVTEEYEIGVEYRFQENGNDYTNVTRFDTRELP
jgi:hypothetical protein